MTMRRCLLMLFAGAVIALGTGCATDEPSNRSARPWNAPKTWETGLPVGLTEGR